MCNQASPDPASPSNLKKNRTLRPQAVPPTASLAELLNEHLDRRAGQVREQFSETTLAGFHDLAQ